MSMSIVRLRYSHFGHAHWALSAVWVRRWNSIIGAWVQVTHRHKQTTTTITCPVHTVPCISSALTCNCKVGKHMRHKQFSSQSADRWPTGPKLVHTILYEYCMYGLTYILFLWFMSIYDTEQRSQSWTTLNLIESENSADTEGKLPNRVVFAKFVGLPNERAKTKKFYHAIFFKKFKVICILNYCLFQNSDILIVIYFLVLVKCLRLCVWTFPQQ